MHPTSEMMSKCRKWHLREPKFAKFHGGACPQTPLEARAFGARVSASSAKKYLPKHNRTPLNRIHPTGLIYVISREKTSASGMPKWRAICTLLKNSKKISLSFEWKNPFAKVHFSIWTFKRENKNFYVMGTLTAML